LRSAPVEEAPAVPREVWRRRLALTDEELREFCRRWRIVRLSIFGSALRADFDSESDLDLLVQFAAEARWPWGGLGEISCELERRLGRPVDVVTQASVEQSPNYIRRRNILSSAQPVYEE